MLTAADSGAVGNELHRMRRKATKKACKSTQFAHTHRTEEHVASGIGAKFRPPAARTRATAGHSVRRVLAVDSRAVPHRSRPICRTGTSIEKSRLKFRKWVFAVCLFVTNPKGVAGTRLAHEFKVQQRTAWFMLHRLRESRAEIGFEEIADPVEADESRFSGERMNISRKRRRELKKAGAGRGTSGQAAVAVLKDRTANKVVARHAPKTGSAHVASLVAQDAKLGSNGKKPARETLASFGSFSEARSHHAHHPCP